MAKRADRRHLLDVAYADDTGFCSRLSLYEHQRPRVDLVAEALDLLSDVNGLCVLDGGCGNGQYLAALRAAGAVVTGLDLSAGMLGSVPPPRPPLLAADVQALALRDAAFDAVLMMHMLYHVPEPARALNEAHRVLHNNGRLLVATNGRRHLAEMDELWLPLLDEAGVLGHVDDLGLVNTRLPADATRDALHARFTVVEERVLRSTVTVTSPEPVVRHAGSTTAAHLSAEQGANLAAAMGERVQRAIYARGDFRITTEVVMFLATPLPGH